MALSLVSLILTFIEIARVASETLTPFAMVFMHVIKLTSAFAILALDIVVYTQRSEGNWSMVGLVVDSALMYNSSSSLEVVRREAVLIPE